MWKKTEWQWSRVWVEIRVIKVEVSRKVRIAKKNDITLQVKRTELESCKCWEAKDWKRVWRGISRIW